MPYGWGIPDNYLTDGSFHCSLWDDNKLDRIVECLFGLVRGDQPSIDFMIRGEGLPLLVETLRRKPRLDINHIYAMFFLEGN